MAKIFLGIDLTKYYGSTNFKNANKVIISRLKYSTRRTDEDYTYSKLYNGKKSYNGSIIHRLATTFKVFIDEYGRKEVIGKTSIKLISNREVNPKHLSQIKKMQSFLAKNKRPLSFNTVLNTFPEISKSIYKDEKTTRKIEPLGIYFTENNAWVVIAYCKLRKEFREFRLDRILQAKTTSKPFDYQEDFTLKGYFSKYLEC